MQTEDRIKLIRQLERTLAKLQAKGWTVTKVRYGENYGEGGLYASVQLIFDDPPSHTGII